jgi:hypothetical protein
MTIELSEDEVEFLILFLGTAVAACIRSQDTERMEVALRIADKINAQLPHSKDPADFAAPEN